MIYQLMMEHNETVDREYRLDLAIRKYNQATVIRNTMGDRASLENQVEAYVYLKRCMLNTI